MSRAAELAELHQLVGNLRRRVTTLQNRYRDDPAMRRVVIDAERILSDLALLDMDAAELELASHTVVTTAEKIAIPDTPYDNEFWRDVDDEGVGGHFRR